MLVEAGCWLCLVAGLVCFACFVESFQVLCHEEMKEAAEPVLCLSKKRGTFGRAQSMRALPWWISILLDIKHGKLQHLRWHSIVFVHQKSWETL